MYTIHKAKQQVITELKTALGGIYVPSMDELELPPDPTMGDIAFPCFVLSKKMKKAPDELATELAAKIGPKEYVGDVKAVGPYVNFVFNGSEFGNEVLDQINKQGKKFGTSDVGKDKRVMVEYANLNTHKDVHIGHLRNLFLGQMLVDVLRATGYDVVPVAYINDLGAHVAKSVWAMKKFHDGEKVDKDKRIDFLREVYVEATAKAEDDPSSKAEITEVFKNLEAQQGEETALWKETRQWSLDYLEKVYDELGLTIETWYFESQLIEKSKKIIDDLIEKGMVKQSEGAWIVDLEEQHLGVNLLVKSDGTLLYNAKDLGLAFKKEEDFHPNRSIYVVDNRQSHALEQLFATLKLMDFDRDLYHLAYDFVTLKDGVMAARTGNVIRYEDFRDDMIAQAKKETHERHGDWDEKKLNEVARAIAFAALRFGILKQDPDKQIVFDKEEALSFEGFTGPYLLYTNARIESILKKASKLKLDYKTDKLTHSLEHQLLVLLSRYPEELFLISSSFHLSRLAQYAYDLSKTFSAFYNELQVISDDEGLTRQRLGLIKGVQQVLQNALDLMGMSVVDEM